MAIGNILAIVLQPLLGMLLDRITRISIKTVLCILCVFCLGMVVGLVVLDVNALWVTVLYIGIVALLLTMYPLVNALVFDYINAGHDVNFSMTRAMGSVCYAILSTPLGIWVNRTSTAILPIVSLALFAGFLLVLLSFPRADRQMTLKLRAERKADQPKITPAVGFLRRYERFIPFLIGIVCLFIFHTIINTFLAQIMVSLGGKNGDIGLSLTIVALCELPAFLGFHYLVARFNNRSLLKVSGVFYALRSIIFLLATSVWMINVGQVFQALSFAIFIPASTYYINEIMREEDKVKGQTFITTTNTLGSFFGSVVGGWLLDFSGVPAMLGFGALGAVAGCLLLVYSVTKPKKPPYALRQDAAG